MCIYLLAYVFKYLFILIGARPVIAASGDGGLESHQAVIARQEQQRPQPFASTDVAIALIVYYFIYTIGDERNDSFKIVQR